MEGRADPDGRHEPREAAPGTIRGDLGIDLTENLVHGSDGPESAAREIGIFFPDALTARPRGPSHAALRRRTGAIRPADRRWLVRPLTDP